MPGEQVVQNALTPEEKPVIENIISLFQQLLSMQNSQAGTEDMIEEAMGEEANMEEVDVTKAVTDETGDDKAEERIDNVTPTTDQSLSELTKSIKTLNSLLSKGQPVRKAAPQQAARKVNKDAQTQVLQQIGTLMNHIVQKQDAQEKLNAQLFEALGFTDDVVKKALPQESEVVQKDKPVQSLDSAVVIKEVLSEVFKNIPAFNQNNTTQHPFNVKRNSDDGVRKNLRSIAEFINKGKRQ